MYIFVFKTGISEHSHLQQVGPQLNALPGLIKWTLAFDDDDKILRVETLDHSSETISRTLHKAGYLCEELAVVF